jgi:hypothetical protein
MTSPQKEYRNLLSLTQSFLLTEFKSKQHVFSDPSTYAFFKEYYSKSQHKQATPRPQHPQEQIQQAPLPRQQQQTPPAPPPQQQQTPPPPPPPQQQVTPQPKPTPKAAPTPDPVKPSQTKEVTKQQQASNKNGHFTFKLDPVTEVKETELFSIRKEVEKQFPEMQLITQPPDDALAKKVGQHWKQSAVEPEVVILSFQETPDQQVFLQNMRAAINQRLAPCVIYSALTIEKRQVWEKLFNMKDLRLIITTDYGMYSLPGLMRHYRESPEKSERYLGGIPLLLLTDITVYLNQPQLKSALWQALSTMLPKTDNS